MYISLCGARADFQTAGLNGVFSHFCRRGQKWVAPERETSPCRLRPKVTRARRRGTASAPPKQKWVAPERETAPYSKKETDADASVSFCISQYASFSARYAFSSPMGTRTCSMVSRSRTVTQLSPAFSASPTVSKSTVMQNGVPTSSSRR